MFNFVSSGVPYSPKLSEEIKKSKQRTTPPGVNPQLSKFTVHSDGKLIPKKNHNILTNPLLSPLLASNPHAKINVDKSKSPFFNGTESSVGSHSIPSVFQKSPNTKLDSDAANPLLNSVYTTVGSHKLPNNFASIKDSKVCSNGKQGFTIISPLEKLSIGSKKQITVY